MWVITAPPYCDYKNIDVWDAKIRIPSLQSSNIHTVQIQNFVQTITKCITKFSDTIASGRYNLMTGYFSITLKNAKKLNLFNIEGYWTININCSNIS